MMTDDFELKTAEAASCAGDPARAGGAGGGAYLVGGGGVIVNVTVDGGAPALLRSEAQIAQMLARAAALGARRL